ncbi:MAG: MerR family transcriptional regulator [Candidatus Edwardsbacteria bacterium]|nr:MerR family transcriptional regulator [Candidatus Edwardsbacteria bacterium]
MNQTATIELVRASKPILSTWDLARIFRVNESSIKRWTDLGVLNCFRTPGGHRRFTVDEAVRFAREQNFVLDDTARRALGIVEPINLDIVKYPPESDSLIPRYRVTSRNGPLPVDAGFASRACMSAFLEGFKLGCACAGLSVADVNIPE